MSTATKENNMGLALGFLGLVAVVIWVCTRPRRQYTSRDIHITTSPPWPVPEQREKKLEESKYEYWCRQMECKN